MFDGRLDYSHSGICVSDLDSALRFYCGGLGFEMVEGYDLDSTSVPRLAEALEVAPPVALRSQMITRDALRIELLAFGSPPPVGTPSPSRGRLGLTHLSFTVDDLDAAADHLVAHGGTIIDGTDVDVGIRIIFLADPDGTRIELMAM